MKPASKRTALRRCVLCAGCSACSHAGASAAAAKNCATRCAMPSAPWNSRSSCTPSRASAHCQTKRAAPPPRRLAFASRSRAATSSTNAPTSAPQSRRARSRLRAPRRAAKPRARHRLFPKAHPQRPARPAPRHRRASGGSALLCAHAGSARVRQLVSAAKSEPPDSAYSAHPKTRAGAGKTQAAHPRSPQTPGPLLSVD